MCEKVPQKETPLCQTIQGQYYIDANIFCQLCKKNLEYQQESRVWIIIPMAITKGGFKSEVTGDFLQSNINIPNHYPEQKI